MARTLGMDDPIFAVPVDHPVFWIAVSPDSRKLFTAHWPGRLRLYDADTLAAGPVIHTPGAVRSAADRKFHGFVRTADFSPDGRTILAGGGTVSEPHQVDGYLQTYDAKTGKPLMAFSHKEPVWGAAFAEGGERVVSACEDRTVRVFQAWDGAELDAVSQSGNPGKVVVGRDGRTVFAGDLGPTGMALLADLGPIEQPFRALKLDGAPITLKFNPADDRLWVADRFGVVSAFDPRTGASERLPVGGEVGFDCFHLQPGDDRMYTWSRFDRPPYQRLQAWDVKAGRHAWDLARSRSWTSPRYRTVESSPVPAEENPLRCATRADGGSAGPSRWIAPGA